MREEILNSLPQFLIDYPGMTTAPFSYSGVFLHGIFRFRANVLGSNLIDDCYELEITVPDKYPQALPEVKETGRKIPRRGDFHVNTNGSLCLGSPLRLLKKVNSDTSLSGFAKNCLVPFLYAVSYKLNNGGEFIFGELSHNEKGILEDYSNLFGLKEKYQIIQALQLLGLKKRIANKKPCPCGCGLRLGACPFHNKLNKYRKLAPLSWFKAQASNVSTGVKR